MSASSSRMQARRRMRMDGGWEKRWKCGGKKCMARMLLLMADKWGKRRMSGSARIWVRSATADQHELSCWSSAGGFGSAPMVRAAVRYRKEAKSVRIHRRCCRQSARSI